MLKKILLPFLAVLLVSIGESQIIVSTTSGGPDISGTMKTISGNSSDLDIYDALYVRNEGDQTVSLKVRRIEEDVENGTTNNICWLLCPAVQQVAGENPDWVTQYGVSLDPGEEDSSFALHYNPSNVTGCSLFKIQWVLTSDNDEVMTEMHYRVIHGSQECATFTSTDDFVRDLSLTLSPNPANEMMRIEVGDFDRPLNLMVTDILGQVVKTDRFNPGQGQIKELTTLDMMDGVYFLSLATEGEIVKTVKFVVSH